MTTEPVPLRWVHLSEPGETADRALGVYVNVADVLYGLDVQGEAEVRRAIEALLDARTAAY